MYLLAVGSCRPSRTVESLSVSYRNTYHLRSRGEKRHLALWTSGRSSYSSHVLYRSPTGPSQAQTLICRNNATFGSNCESCTSQQHIYNDDARNGWRVWDLGRSYTWRSLARNTGADALGEDRCTAPSVRSNPTVFRSKRTRCNPIPMACS